MASLSAQLKIKEVMNSFMGVLIGSPLDRLRSIVSECVTIARIRLPFSIRCFKNACKIDILVITAEVGTDVIFSGNRTAVRSGAF